MSKIHNGRDETFDIARGLLILVVVLGHSIQFIGYLDKSGFWTDPLFKAIYMFHMPLFMAYSGYFSPPRTLGLKDIRKRARSLIYPMFSFSIIIVTLKFATSQKIAQISPYFLHAFLSNYWFLWAAFLCFLSVWIAETLGVLKWVSIAVIFATAVEIDPYWSVMSLFAFMLPFFIIGRAARLSPHKLNYFSHPFFYSLSVIGTILCFSFWQFDNYIYNNRANYLLHSQDVAHMFIGAFCATYVAFRLFDSAGHSLKNSALSPIFSYLGRHTLEIYLTQGVVFAGSSQFLKFIPFSGSENLFVRYLVSAGFSTLLILFIAFGIHISYRYRVLARILWGRTRS